MTTTQENNPRAIFKRLFHGRKPMVEEAVWMLKAEHWRMEPEEFTALLKDVACRLKQSSKDKRGLSKICHQRLDQAVQEATGKPLADWLPSRKQRKAVKP